MTRPALVVFDIDDTLYLERDYVTSGFAAVGRYMAEQRGVDDFAERARARFAEGGRNTVFDDVLRSYGWQPDSDLVAALVGVYRDHRPDIALLPDARSCLDAATAARVSVGVLTDGPLSSQQAKADALGLERWASLIVCTAAYGPEFCKPGVAGFELLARHAGAEGRACAYVADNPAKDFGGPARLGWRTVRVRRAGSLHELVDAGPDVEVEVADLDGVGAELGLDVRTSGGTP